MKQLWIHFAKNGLVAILILVCIVSMIVFPKNGAYFMDGNVYIRSMDDVTNQVNVVYGSFIPGTPVQMLHTSEGANQTFIIEHIIGDEYALRYGNQGLCIAVASDMEQVVIQGLDTDNEYNLWHINRLSTTQGVMITNVATGKSLTYDFSEELRIQQLIVRDYDEADSKFAFVLAYY